MEKVIEARRLIISTTDSAKGKKAVYKTVWERFTEEEFEVFENETVDIIEGNVSYKGWTENGQRLIFSKEACKGFEIVINIKYMNEHGEYVTPSSHQNEQNNVNGNF